MPPVDPAPACGIHLSWTAAECDAATLASADALWRSLFTGAPPPLAWDQSDPGSAHLFWGGLLVEAAYGAVVRTVGPCDAFAGAFVGDRGSQPVTRDALVAGLRDGYTACGVTPSDAVLAQADQALAGLPSSTDPDQATAGFTLVWSRPTWACGEGSSDEMCMVSKDGVRTQAAAALSNALFYAGVPVESRNDLMSRVAEVFHGHADPRLSLACTLGLPWSLISSDCRPEPKRAGEAAASAVDQVAREYGLSQEEAASLAELVRASNLDR